ncbi:MAG: hypothetical protein IIC13_05580 [SAR324 cluster bacterium]|nr:hypothetical protein [SAR324 cluster bacterium]MCH8886040.1 hypothetical protein [SAR324 cluster bacterium]
MICYRCRDTIAEEDFFYNDHEKFVCKPCFEDARRCFICRFPGNQMEEVEGLGMECEFCRGKLVMEGIDMETMVAPLRSFLLPFGFKVPDRPRWVWTDRQELRSMQTGADLPPDEFIDDFLRYCYPVYYHEGAYHLLRRMTKPTFIAYAVVQLAAGDLSGRYALPDLAGISPFHIFGRGWCHWLGYEVTRLLGYDLERRQLRKWPQLGAQGDFERWERMSRVNKPGKMVAYFKANLSALVKKNLAP